MSILSTVGQVAVAAAVALCVVVFLLAVVWHHSPSFSTAVRAAASSILGSRRRRRRQMPSNVRHRLRLRLPAASLTGFAASVDGCTSTPTTVTDSPTVSAGGWAPQMLALHAKKQQLQHARKDSGDSCDANVRRIEERLPLSSSTTSFLTSSNLQTPSELLPGDFEESELTFFDRRLELLTDD